MVGESETHIYKKKEDAVEKYRLWRQDLLSEGCVDVNDEPLIYSFFADDGEYYHYLSVNEQEII
jgi:hypothetical protein